MSSQLTKKPYLQDSQLRFRTGLLQNILIYSTPDLFIQHCRSPDGSLSQV